MRVLNCLYYEHDLWLVAMAGLMCAIGSLVTMKLFARTVTAQDASRLHWGLLSGLTGGAAIWSTHFIAMMGYNPGVPVELDGVLTIASALIAAFGTGLGILLAATRSRGFAVICGGGTIGLSIAGMHFLGMFAYRAEGIVRWAPEYVAASLICAVGFSILAIDCLRRYASRSVALPTLLLALAIVTLHFVGMAAFSVVPLEGAGAGAAGAAFDGLAAAIAVVSFLVVCAGISTHLVERRTQEQADMQLRHLALHDSMTGLANRRHFNEELQAASRRLASMDTPFALLVVDLDRFKPINDTLGHPFGDAVLRRVAQRLRRAVREQDIVARIGGDEFAVIVTGTGSWDETSAIAARIVEILGRPIIIDGRLAEIGASVGIARAPEHGTRAEELTVNADMALYTVKRGGRSGYCQFEPRFTEEIRSRRALEADLRRACRREDFFVMYQPIKDAASGSFTGAEALIRWDCPKRGPVSPSEFVPVAEDLGLISKIGRFVLGQACRDAASWPEPLGVAVNLSPVQLLDPRLPQLVSEALEDAGLEPSRLELEITETALLTNDDLALASLRKLRAIGVSISLDDFGTGYSSLSYLHRFPISRIKIDRSFVQRLPVDEGSASIVRAIAQLGRSLDMKITAEGIESADQLDAIASSGCGQVQGFLISKPLLSVDIAKLFGPDAKRDAA